MTLHLLRTAGAAELAGVKLHNKSSAQSVESAQLVHQVSILLVAACERRSSNYFADSMKGICLHLKGWDVRHAVSKVI
jgi:hypothetical protein